MYLSNKQTLQPLRCGKLNNRSHLPHTLRCKSQALATSGPARCSRCSSPHLLPTAVYLCAFFAEHPIVSKGWSWSSSWRSGSSGRVPSRSVPHQNAGGLDPSRGTEAPLQGCGRCSDQNHQGRGHNGAVPRGWPHCHTSHGLEHGHACIK